MVVSLADLRALLAAEVPPGRADEDGVRRQWWAALATLQEDLLAPGPGAERGLWLAAPLPALYEPRLLRRLRGWVWAPAGVEQLLPTGAPLLPGRREPQATAEPFGFQRLPLHPDDGTDPLLLLITPAVQVALALDGPPQARRLIVRFDAEVLAGALQLVLQRLHEDNPRAADALAAALQALGPLDNAPELALQFWPRLAERLAAIAPSVTLQPLASPRSDGSAGELALLEALTHEVRTPLATIRTLIRSLLRRRELTPLVRQRLEQIDSEC
ncbi:MAG: histidine kinase dimerization/phospho-acceptor domain-containing protein, partial [Synechococcaceae cyanobacterium]|nr:histidine kinase dimerization/phospho-acceptor domain-containing protein [Synechococcaceae cyanobacterium]